MNIKLIFTPATGPLLPVTVPYMVAAEAKLGNPKHQTARREQNTNIYFRAFMIIPLSG
ncbi:MAG: hypothetical protein WGN25_13020 [Candidatus Electrothrix sp. GW3-4]|uniref:hypothetical protein n=1 Tax=Candidatus Electrothrix sp. GW3-4 TaxID=3126740 RepID=UPI0030D6068E